MATQSTQARRQVSRIQGGWASDVPRPSGSAGLGRGRGKGRGGPALPLSDRQGPSAFQQQNQQLQQQQQRWQQQQQLPPQALQPPPQQQLGKVGLGRGRGRQRCSPAASSSDRQGPSDLQQQNPQQEQWQQQWLQQQQQQWQQQKQQQQQQQQQRQQQPGSGGPNKGQGKERHHPTAQRNNRKGPPSDLPQQHQQQQRRSGGFSKGQGKERHHPPPAPQSNRQGPPSNSHQRSKKFSKKNNQPWSQAGPLNRAPCRRCGGPFMGPGVGCLCSEDGPSSISNQSSIGQPQDLCSAITFVQPEMPVVRKAVEPIVLEQSGNEVLSAEPSGESRVELIIDFLSQPEADEAFCRLLEEVKWKQQINKNRSGEEYDEPRLVAWYGEHPYAYSKVKMDANSEWPPTLLELKKKIETTTNMTFNSVLANKYRNEKDGVAWHSDDEYGLRDQPKIASLSLGETRMFEMRMKPPKGCDPRNYDYTESKKYRIPLTSGCLLLMTGHTQDDWQHRVPKEYHEKQTRINLTFRNIYPDDRHDRTGYTSYQVDG